MIPASRRLAPLLLVAAFALAGCIGAAPSEDGSTPLGESPPTVPDATTVFGGDGAGRLAAALPDVALPVGVGRYTGGAAFEPTIGVGPDGTIAFSSLEYGDNRAFGIGEMSNVRVSIDHGKTWEDATPHVGPVSSPPASFDPYVHVDRDTGRIFVLDMQGLQCNWLSFSDDSGDSWTSNPVACGQPPLEDHPTLWTGPPRTASDKQAVQNGPYENVVYLCVNRLADTACSRSLDGGLTWTPYRPLVFAGNDGGCGGLTGHGVAGPEGRIYLGQGCGKPAVAMSADDGRTWTVSQVSEELNTTRHDVHLAVDAAGNVYALWQHRWDPYLAVSTDHGKSWSDPVEVAPPQVRSTVFPDVAAGSEGRVAIIYMGTDADGIPNRMDGDDAWHGYITTSLDATAEDPTFATTRINPADDPLAKGPCDDDNRCDGIGDFLDVNVGPKGRPYAAFMDVCDSECVEGEKNHGVKGLLGTLEQGPSLRGNLTSLPRLPS